MIGGIGASKTMGLAIVATLLSYENPPAVPGMVVAPTFQMLRDVDEVAVEEFWLQQGIPFESLKSEHAYYLPECGNKILFRSCDDPHKLRGPNVGWVLGDEPAMWTDDPAQPQASAVNIAYGRVRHPRAARHVFGVFGTPNGFDHLYARLAEPDGNRRLPGAWFTTCPTWENQHLPAGYVEGLKAAYDPLLYRQEVCGEFVNVSGMGAYHAFDRAAHLKAYEHTPSLPLFLCCDFNIRGVWVVAQGDPSKKIPLRVIDEIPFDGADSTTKAAKEFLARYGEFRDTVEVYADASGENRKSTGLSDFEVLREALHAPVYSRYGGNGRVKDRVAAVNALLRNAHGEVRMFVHPTKCPRLVKDLEQVRWKEGSYELDKTSNGDLTHASDALGYLVRFRWPIVADAKRDWRAA